ncbi:hypothetical protein SLS62_011221 [Diatrype stigma]|uniref:Transmembrane protein n=1 Tax=Diatrype stigma TaxID=117547 RepID=A0AAN9UC66_9PEZI
MAPRHTIATTLLGSFMITSAETVPTATPESPFTLYEPPSSSGHPLAANGEPAYLLPEQEYADYYSSNAVATVATNPDLHRRNLFVGIGLMIFIPWVLVVSDKTCKLELGRLFRPVREKCIPAFYILVLAWWVVAFLILVLVSGVACNTRGIERKKASRSQRKPGPR